MAISPAVSSEEFANWAGTSRGSALRALSWLEDKGVIQRVGHEFVVNLGELHKALSRRPYGHPGDQDGTGAASSDSPGRWSGTKR